jgi:hypothetical protein
MESSAFRWRMVWWLGCLTLCGLPAACVRQDAGKSKGGEPDKAALNNPKADARPLGEDKSESTEPKKHALYDPKADARAQIDAATAMARRQNGRVLVIFGFEG